MKIIGVAGTNSGAGATHYAIALAHTLKDNKYKTALVEMNGSGDFISLGKEVGIIEDEDDFDGDYFTHKGLDFFVSSNKSLMFALKQGGFEYVIADYGTNLTDEYFTCDCLVVVSTCAEWKRGTDEVFEVFEKIEETIGLQNLNIAVPFSNKERLSAIEEFAKKSNVMAVPYEPDAFESTVDITYVPKDVAPKKISKLEKELRDKEDKIREAQKKAEQEELTRKQKEKELKEKEKEIKEHKSFFDRFRKDSEEEKARIQREAEERQRQLELEKQQALEEEQRRAREEQARLEEEARLEKERIEREAEKERIRLENEKAEQLRRAEEQRQEQLRLAEEQRLKEVAEQKRLAEEKEAEAERQRQLALEKERLAKEAEEQARIEEERRRKAMEEVEKQRLENERLAKEKEEKERLAREAEEKRQAEEKARLEALAKAQEIEEERQRIALAKEKEAELRRQAEEQRQKAEEERLRAEAEKQEALENIDRKVDEKIKDTREELERRKKEAEENRRILEEKQQQFEKEQKEKEEKLKQLQKEREDEHYQATHDPMTDAGNRKGYNEYMDGRTEYRVIFFDVNNLKKTNDGLGHTFGDELIMTVCTTIRSHYEHIFRVGGDEFIAVTDLSDDTELQLSQIDDFLAEKTKNHAKIVFQVAHGYADSTEGETLQEVSDLADGRMYEDKRIKKGQKVYDVNFAEAEDFDYTDYDETSIISDEEMAEYECIVGTEMETMEYMQTKFEKRLDTLWYLKQRISYEHMGNFAMFDVYVFPTEYQTAPRTVQSIIAIDLGNRYIYSLNTAHSIEIGTAEFQCTLRFMTDGKMNFAIFEGNENTHIMERGEAEMHECPITPRYFGKTFTTKDGKDIEIYPIKENMEGLCDCIIKDGDELYLSNGMETGLADVPVSFILNEDKGVFQIMEDS